MVAVPARRAACRSSLDLGQVWNPRPRPQSGRLRLALPEALVARGLGEGAGPLGALRDALTSGSSSRRAPRPLLGPGRGGAAVAAAEVQEAGRRPTGRRSAAGASTTSPSSTGPLRPGVTPSAHGPGRGQPAGGAEEEAVAAGGVQQRRSPIGPWPPRSGSTSCGCSTTRR